MEYRKRIVDQILKEKMEAFGAVFITGPKGCGKTTTAKHHSNSFIEFQDEDRRQQYLSVADVMPSKLLMGKKPILFDEWQDAPKIWGAIRKSIDDTQIPGQFILTGSTSSIAETPHTGTLRISRMDMLPMSLYETGESNGTVSLKDLFEDPSGFEGCHSDLDMNGIIFAICRGGWPQTLNLRGEKSKLLIAKDLFKQTCEVDISNISKMKLNSRIAEKILRSYSRNICTLAENTTIIADVKKDTDMCDSTFYDYVRYLEDLHIISNIGAWCPAIRSKSAIRATDKRNLIDPSIAVAALGVGPDYFNTDFNTLGFLFESLCARDLRIYSAPLGGSLSYYHDRYGLEADLVLHLADGRYALCEVKLGQKEVDEGAEHLLMIESLVRKYNERERQAPLRLPDIKIVLTGTEFGYRRDDGVLVIPIGCLRD